MMELKKTLKRLKENVLKEAEMAKKHKGTPKGDKKARKITNWVK